jgi:heme-degrading monooxygenase HmoA
MYAVVRRYARAEGLGEALLARQAEVTQLLSSVPGFKAYYAVRTSDGSMATFTVCNDRSGTEESTRRAGEWVRANLSTAPISAPEITEGETILNF